MAAPQILADLVGQARGQTARRRAALPEAELARLIERQAPPRDFAAALAGAPRPALIAEMKRRTPSMGLLAPDYEPGRLAGLYAEAGAAAISVLTHEAGFGGAPEHLAEARAAAGLPILRKDFIVEEHQVLEARALGADAVLLIVAALEPARLRALLALAAELGLAALVEVHDEAEMAAAAAAGARVIGVNNRDLRTFEVDLGLVERLRGGLPDGALYVAESGIHGRDDVARMRDAGADAVLVGEAIMRAADPVAKIRELLAAAS